jgi:hypothetical protein
MREFGTQVAGFTTEIHFDTTEQMAKKAVFNSNEAKIIAQASVDTDNPSRTKMVLNHVTRKISQNIPNLFGYNVTEIVSQNVPDLFRLHFNMENIEKMDSRIESALNNYNNAINIMAKLLKYDLFQQLVETQKRIYSYQTGFGQPEVVQYHLGEEIKRRNAYLEEISKYKELVQPYCQALQALGTGVHSLQDMITHNNQTVGHVFGTSIPYHSLECSDVPFGNYVRGYLCDDIDQPNDPQKYLDANKITFQYLSAFQHGKDYETVKQLIYNTMKDYVDDIYSRYQRNEENMQQTNKVLPMSLDMLANPITSNKNSSFKKRDIGSPEFLYGYIPQTLKY